MQSGAMQKVYVILVTLCLLAFFGYNVFIKSSDLSGITSPTVVGQELLTLVDRLNSISIDYSVFSSNLFSSLIDTSANIFPESYGRLNPFAPIGTEF